MPRSSGVPLRCRSDEYLATLAADGDDDAFAVLVQRYRRPMRTVAGRCGGRGGEEDIVQQAFAQAWAALRGGTEVTHVRAWLFQIVRRASWSAAAIRPVEELNVSLAAPADTAMSVENSLEARRVLDGVQRLPSRQQLAVVQTALEGRSCGDVAATLGLTENAVRQLLFRARATLRAGVHAAPPLPALARLVQLLGGGGPARGGTALARSALIVVATVTPAATAIHHVTRETTAVPTAAVASRPNPAATTTSLLRPRIAAAVHTSSARGETGGSRRLAPISLPRQPRTPAGTPSTPPSIREVPAAPGHDPTHVAPIAPAQDVQVPPIAPAQEADADGTADAPPTATAGSDDAATPPEEAGPGLDDRLSSASVTETDTTGADSTESPSDTVGSTSELGDS